MSPIALRVVCAGLLIGLLGACDRESLPKTGRTTDVTPGNAANIVEQTGAKVDAALQQNTQALDAAIDAQSTGTASE